jgi:hypothetical protein
LLDFYDKIVNDHPLVEYIEDGFALSDVKALKKYIKRTREGGKVSIGIKQLFNSDLDVIKEYTTYI